MTLLIFVRGSPECLQFSLSSRESLSVCQIKQHAKSRRSPRRSAAMAPTRWHQTKSEVARLDYSMYSREQLVEMIDEMKMLNRELLAEQHQATKLEFSWTGNLGHWYWNIKTDSVVFNPLKVESLGYQMSELPTKISFRFFTEKLHPDDYQKTMQAMSAHLKDESPVYEIEYRIQAKAGTWKWFYDRGKITQRDAQGKPEFLAGIVFDITEKKLQEMQLAERNLLLTEQSSIDALTGILNRRAILDELKLRLNQAMLQHYPLSIAMIDIDLFKNVNDTWGHTFGDLVLEKTAKTIHDSLRGLDVVGRYGGEEFLVIYPNTSKENAFTVTERIRRTIENLEMENGIKITVSAGIAVYTQEEIIALIDKADQQLYKAKNSGRNRVL